MSCAATVAGGAGAALAAAVQWLAAAQCALAEPWPPHAHPPDKSCFDFVIAGGGTAGAALAARLAGSGSAVLLLEAGPDPPIEAIIPGLKDSLRRTTYDWNFTTQAEAGVGQGLRGGRGAQPRGRMLGGSGALNDMVYARGFPADYDAWAAALGPHWNWTNVLRYFKKTERLTDELIVDDPHLAELHGCDGEIEVSGFKNTTLSNEIFLKAFEEAGFERVKDMTYPGRIGAGHFSHTIRRGRRDSTVTALLNKAGERKNLFVVRNALVTKILIANDTAYGVKVLIDDKEMDFYASKEVIVSAGTFNTPKILQLSGIGPRAHLEELGIDVVVDLPVGDNLHDHVMVLKYIAADPGACESDAGAVHLGLLQYLAGGGGPLAYTHSAGAYLSLNETDPNLPTFAFYPSCMPVGTDFYDGCTNFLRLKGDICTKLQAVLEDKELISVAVVLLKPESRGRVRLQSTDPLAEPLIYAGTFSDARDLELYPQALRVVDSLIETSYFKEKNARVVDLEIDVCEGKEGEEAARCGARAVAMAAWHAAGSARMGGVLGARLRVRGVRGLRVADASAMPRVPRGNTNAPVVMLAEQAADFIKADYHLL